MHFENVFIPYGAYWSIPFVKSNHDPWAQVAMIQTAENVAREQEAAFHRCYMVTPHTTIDRKGRRARKVINKEDLAFPLRGSSTLRSLRFNLRNMDDEANLRAR